MKYKIFPSKVDALNYSEQAGIEAGLAYHAGKGSSRYMWSVIEHPNAGQGACFCPEGEKTREELKTEGWFAEPDSGGA